MIAFCVRCRAKRTMKAAKSTSQKNGKQLVKGICPVCGERMFRYKDPVDTAQVNTQNAQA